MAVLTESFSKTEYFFIVLSMMFDVFEYIMMLAMFLVIIIVII